MSNKNEIIRNLRAENEAMKQAALASANLTNSLPPTPSSPSSGDLKGTLNNSLSSLVEGATQQSRLTALTPILANNLYYPVTLNYLFLMYAYKTHGILQTAIDMPVLDAFRGGLDISSKELDSEDIEEFCHWLEEK